MNETDQFGSAKVYSGMLKFLCRPRPPTYTYSPSYTYSSIFLSTYLKKW